MSDITTDTEEQFIILAALLMLRLLGESRPARAKVIEFISGRKLIRLYSKDLKMRSTGDEAWINDLSWAREDLKKKGFLEMPSSGIWKLTEKGRDLVETTANEFAARAQTDPEAIPKILSRLQRISGELLACLVKIGNGEKWWL